MGLITKTKTYADNDPIVYSDLNANWDTLYNLVNGNLDNSNIASGAAIDSTKISGGAVTLTTPQTVPGQKTFIKPILNSVQNLIQDVYASTITLDMTSSNLHNIVLTGNATLAVVNVSAQQFFAVELVQDATGNRSVTWWSGINWEDNTAPILSSSANVKDTFVFKKNADGTYDGYIGGQGIPVS